MINLASNDLVNQNQSLSMFFINVLIKIWGYTFKFITCQNRKNDVLVNKSAFVNGHF